MQSQSKPMCVCVCVCVCVYTTDFLIKVSRQFSVEKKFLFKKCSEKIRMCMNKTNLNSYFTLHRKLNLRWIIDRPTYESCNQMHRNKTKQKNRIFSWLCSRQNFFRQDQKLLSIKKHSKLYFTKKFLLIKRYHQENEEDSLQN